MGVHDDRDHDHDDSEADDHDHGSDVGEEAPDETVPEGDVAG